MVESHVGFITHPVYQIEDGRAIIYLYGRLQTGESFRIRQPYRPYFFVHSDKADDVPALSDVDIEPTDLTDFDETPVSKVILDIPKTVPTLRDTLLEANVSVFEADVPFTSRFLIDNDVRGTVRITGEATETPDERFDLVFDEPELANADWQPMMNDITILSVDIETDPDHDVLYSIAYTTNTGENDVFIVTDEDIDSATPCESVRDALQKFRNAVHRTDPDVITGWNVIDFDFERLATFHDEHDVPFDYGRVPDESDLTIRSAYMRDSSMDVTGRMVLDGIHVLRNNFIDLDDYKLRTAAEHFLDETKLFGAENKEATIQDAYHDEPGRLAEYNLHDAELVLDILEASNALDVSLLRSCLTGMPLDRVSSTIASFDSLYLPRLREAGYVAPITNYGQGKKTSGGHVMDSQPGIYENVIVCDFKSLYPSIMRTFNIDPLSHHKGKTADNPINAPNDASFSRDHGILPRILDGLTAEKDKATEQEAWVTRSAVKILMNSMYGVLASPNCRFYSEALANAITSFGHTLLKHTRSVLEERGYTVIYGDTDSIFINLGVENGEKARDQGVDLARSINDHYETYLHDNYDVQSNIILEFEKLYLKFFTPPQRGSGGGAKKRYAGLIEKDGEERIDFVGLEYVRRDWTEAAKTFQKSLLWRAFQNEPVDEYVRSFVDEVRSGEHDDKLTYTKGLSKAPSEYTKTTPQHVKAAKKLDDFNSNVISYVMTVDGPEPIQAVTHSIDYDHYVEKQLKPVASSILSVLGKTFYDVMQGTEQLDLSSF